MATYYVGSGGNNANAGTSWAQRKATLNGAEDIPVEAGDTVYVGPGTYRELLTCDANGSSGSPITYIGDYTGANTDGVGGVVRITGSDNDIAYARNFCVVANKDYRTFIGFSMDSASPNYSLIYTSDGTRTGLTVEKCHFSSQSMAIKGVNNALISLTIRNCCFAGYNSALYIGGTTTDNSNNLIENCLVYGISGTNYAGININNGGTVIKNCTFIGVPIAIYVGSLNTGQTVTVNNCTFHNCYNAALSAATLGNLVEDYNNLSRVEVARKNVAVGANSLSYYALYDTRWFFEMVNGGSILTPFDLASYSQLINVAGTTPTTADMRGTTVQGTQREWGALEYDSTLDIEAGTGAAGGLITHPGMTGGING